MSASSHQSGFLQIIIVVIVAILVLAYFKVDIRELVASERFQDAQEFIIQTSAEVWNDIIKGPFVLLLENIVDKIRDEESQYFQKFKNERDERTILPEDNS